MGANTQADRGDSERLVPLIKSLLNRARQDEKLGVVIDAVRFHVQSQFQFHSI